MIRTQSIRFIGSCVYSYNLWNDGTMPWQDCGMWRQFIVICSNHGDIYGTMTEGVMDGWIFWWLSARLWYIFIEYAIEMPLLWQDCMSWPWFITVGSCHGDIFGSVTEWVMDKRIFWWQLVQDCSMSNTDTLEILQSWILQCSDYGDIFTERSDWVTDGSQNIYDGTVHGSYISTADVLEIPHSCIKLYHIFFHWWSCYIMILYTASLQWLS